MKLKNNSITLYPPYSFRSLVAVFCTSWCISWCIAVSIPFNIAWGATPAHEEQPTNHETWEDWVQSKADQSDSPVVQSRQISKANRVQLILPLVGMSDRKDYYTNYMVSGAARFHLSEKHGWELIRVNFGFPQASQLNQEIKNKTDYQTDVQLSKFQLSSSYVFSPIYGKYAWGGDSLVYFDMFATAGVGLRFASDRQPFAETGVGMNHYIFARKLAVVPEYRLRIYSEKRTESTMVFESMFQLGGSWLF
jgi:outer membrane beta-barrel protein